MILFLADARGILVLSGVNEAGGRWFARLFRVGDASPEAYQKQHSCKGKPNRRIILLAASVGVCRGGGREEVVL